MDIGQAYDALRGGQVNQIHNIAVKAVELDDNLDLMTVEMDLTATNLKCRLDFGAMILCEDDFQVMHDVYGINRHLNKTTFELENCFCPRFAIQ